MASLLNAALPASIQSRIPKFPVLGRTVNLPAAFFRSDSSTELVSASSPPSPPSPPSSRSSRPSTPHTEQLLNAVGSSFDGPALGCKLQQTTALAVSRTGVGAELAPQEASSRQNTPAWGWGSRRNGSGDSADLGLVLAGPARPKTATPASEVNWKYGQNGFQTLKSALREAGDPDRLPALERQIYVESVAYLLRGLPADLDSGEVHRLRNAAPNVLLDPAPGTTTSTDELLQLQQQQQQQQQPLLTGPRQYLAICPRIHADGRLQSRSLPHMMTHWLVTRVYGLVLLLIPVATYLVRMAIDLDRKYHLPEVVFAWGVGAFLVLYKYAAELFVAVCNMADGRVGRAFDGGTAYVASGVASGFREAVLDVVQTKA